MSNVLFAAANRLRDGLGMHGSQSISPTAFYTGYVWARHQLGPASLATPEGRALYWALQPTMTALTVAGLPTLEQVLLARHAVLDELLTEAVESGRISTIVEIAAGMSPRGLSFAERFGAQITYIETDLPGMAALKRGQLEKLGALTPWHRVEALDALAGEGAGGLEALAAGLDHSAGLAIITEGLLNYLPREAVEGLWSRIATVLGGFPQGVYLSDLHVAEDHTKPLERLCIALLSAFVKGMVHLHFPAAEDVREALVRAGFGTIEVVRPTEFAATVEETLGNGAAFVRIIEARTGG